jgi:hypothetical protein
LIKAQKVFGQAVSEEKIFRNRPTRNKNFLWQPCLLTICCFCSGVIEDETHVLLNCPFYDDFRENLFNVAKCCIVDFMSFNNEEKIMLLFSIFFYSQ